ncbi:MAG: Rid family hydrolase [Rhodospirillaceae bacterium]
MTEIQRFLLPDEMEPVSHYCHATRAGDRVWVSGTVGRRADGTIPDDVVEQFQIAIDAVDRCLKAAGAEARHVVKVTVLLTDIADRAKINPIRQRYFGEHRPASTLFEVSALVAPEMKVEIEVEAVIAG